MRNRQERHDVIRDIIRSGKINTQRDLAEQLEQAGYESTHATISRDVMDMGLIKSRDGFYVFPAEIRLQRLVSELVSEVHVSGNMVVLRTHFGAAAGVSAAIDKAELPGAIGVVGSDKTVMVAAESPEAADSIGKTINHLRRR